MPPLAGPRQTRTSAPPKTWPGFRPAPLRMESDSRQKRTGRGRRPVACELRKAFAREYLFVLPADGFLDGAGGGDDEVAVEVADARGAAVFFPD